jgi:hypothetical protein
LGEPKANDAALLDLPAFVRFAIRHGIATV